MLLQHLEYLVDLSPKDVFIILLFVKVALRVACNQGMDVAQLIRLEVLLDSLDFSLSIFYFPSEFAILLFFATLEEQLSQAKLLKYLIVDSPSYSNYLVGVLRHMCDELVERVISISHQEDGTHLIPLMLILKQILDNLHSDIGLTSARRSLDQG